MFDAAPPLWRDRPHGIAVIRFSLSLMIMTLALDTHQDFVLRKFEIILSDDLAILPCRDRALPRSPGLRESAPAKAGCSARNDGEVDVVRKRSLLCMDLEDAFAAPNVRPVNDHAPVESGPGLNSAGSSTSGRFVAATRITPSFDSKPSISTSNWFKCLLPLVVTAAKTRSSMPSRQHRSHR